MFELIENALGFSRVTSEPEVVDEEKILEHWLLRLLRIVRVGVVGLANSDCSGTGDAVIAVFRRRVGGLEEGGGGNVNSQVVGDVGSADW